MMDLLTLSNRSMFCKIDDSCQIHYEIVGDILPRDTIFIHGNIASNRWWYPTMSVLKNRGAAQQTDYKGRAILIEFRGCGKSSPPQSLKDASMDVFCDDILAVSKFLGLKEFDIVGHSTGGLIAALVAARETHKVVHFLALDPVGAKGIQFAPGMEQAFEAMKNDRSLTATVIGSTIHNNDPEKDFFTQVIVEDAYHAVKTVGLYVLKNLDPFDATDKIAKITSRSLFLHGEYDNLLPMDDTKSMAALCKNGHFAMLAGQGHCTNIENPERFAEILIDFFVY